MSQPSPTATFHHDVYPYISPTKPILSLAGKTVLITGGGQGIGASIAESFSLANAAHIVLLGRNLSTLNRTKSTLEALSANKSSIHVFEADITDQPRIDAVFDEVASTTGKIDVYIANAGFLPPPTPIASLSPTDLQHGLSINIVGQLIALQAFLRHHAPNATFISFNTAVAHISYKGPVGAYVASKAALGKLVEALHVEEKDVRVFSVHPGLVRSAMSEKAGMSGMASETPELAAALSVWLASAEAEPLRGKFVWASWDVEELLKLKELREDPEFLQLGLEGWSRFGHKVKGPFEQ